MVTLHHSPGHDNLEDDLRDHLFKVAQTISRALKQAYRAPKVGVVVAGLEVPHVHIHLVPIYTVKDLPTSNVDPSPSAESLKPAAELIRGALSELNPRRDRFAARSRLPRKPTGR
jgi:histidine triad (HIT) family protein